MSAQESATVRALFADMGIEFEQSGTTLVIDRFEQWRDNTTAAARSITTCFCRADMLEAA